MNNPNEFVDTAKDKFDFLVREFGFIVTAAKAQGTYHSEIIFTSDSLKITIGIWGQGNEIWIIFFPQNKNFPPLHLPNLLNRITEDDHYFQENIESKLTSPIFAQSYPQYLDLCAVEIKKHCQKILTGDFAQWDKIIN